MACRVGKATLSRRLLMFVAVVGLSAGVAIAAAYQAEHGLGSALGMFGTLAIGGTLWFVAWRRGAWRLRDGNGALSVCLAGVIAVAAAGSSGLSSAVLAVRGEPVEVVVLMREAPDADGYRLYTL